MSASWRGGALAVACLFSFATLAAGSAPALAAIALAVDPADTTTTVMASSDPSVPAQLVDVCAYVSEAAPGTRNPDGTVTFTGAGLGEEAVTLVDGVACLTTSDLITGTILATYAGNERYTGSAGSVPVTVASAPTAIWLRAARTGDSVELCAYLMADNPAGKRSPPPVFTMTFTGLGDLHETVVVTSYRTCITVDDVAGGTATATFDGGLSFDASSGTVTVPPAPPTVPPTVAPTVPPTVAPASPTVPLAVAAVSSVEVSWEPPAAAASVTGYTATASPGPAVCTTTGGTSCLLGGTAGTTYTVIVVAHSAAGDSPPSEVSNPATPMTPSTPSAPPASEPTLTTTEGDISVARPAQRIVFVGTGFLPFSTVVLSIYSAPQVLGTVTADAGGTFERAITMPARLAAGEHSVVALGVTPDGTARAIALEVTVPTGAPAAALPVTGPAITLLLMVGVALAVTGIGLVGVSRMRPWRRLR